MVRKRKNPIDPARRESWSSPESLAQQARDGIGVYGCYNDFEKSGDVTVIESHNVTKDDYAFLYARNLQLQLNRIGIPLEGRVLDAGCGMGAITNGIKRLVGEKGEVFGIDLSDAAIRMARSGYRDCTFHVQQAAALEIFGDDTLDLIHAREFYPFTRTKSVAIHMEILSTFHRKLTPGGSVLSVQIMEDEGLGQSLADLKGPCRELGFDRVRRHVMVPLRLYRKIGKLAHAGPMPALVTLAGLALEKIRPGTVSYLFEFRKKPAEG